MNVHNTSPQWRKTPPDQKVEIIIQAYATGRVNAFSLAEWLSAYFDYPLTDDHVRELYRRNVLKGGKLAAFPLQPALRLKKQPKTEIDLDTAERLWREGISGVDIANMFGITSGQLYELTAQHRRRFPARCGPGTLVYANHPHRVTRMTNGWPITLPRISIIDGAAQ